MSTVAKSALAGTIAGIAESAVVHPTDVIKTRSQARGYQNLGILRAFQSAFMNEGVVALYKGIAPTIISIVPKVMLQMGGLAFFKPHFEGRVPAMLVPSMAGICTSIVQAVLFLTSTETIKVRQQTQIGWSGKYDSMMGTASKLIREEGFPSLYKGLLATTVRQSWGLVIKLSGYEGMKAVFLHMERQKTGSDKPQLAAWQHATSGGIANIVVGVLNSPPDVVKTRMQDQSFAAESGGSVYKGTWDCILQMWQTEGAKSFFRGSVMRIVRIVPGGAIQFGVYGTVMNWLEDAW